MKNKIFDKIPIKRLIHKDRLTLYTLGDVFDTYKEFEYKADNIHFIAHYKESNGYWQAYSLKYNTRPKIIKGENYIVIVNNKKMNTARGVKILYQDKLVRFLSITCNGVKDFIFVIKNPKNNEGVDSEL